MENLPPDFWTHSAAFTKSLHRQAYPAIDPTKPSNSAAGRVVVITGASRGIGKAGLATAFIKAGAKAVVLTGRKQADVDAVAKELQPLNSSVKLLPVATDLTHDVSVAELFAKVKAEFGHADVLVNNASRLGIGPIVEREVGDWWADFETNARGTFLVTKHFLQQLPDPKSTPAVIVTISSGAGHTVLPTMSSYSLSKLVQTQFTAIVAAETGDNVTAFAVHPGVVKTDMLTDSFARFALDDPLLAGGLAVWLASDNGRTAAFLSGKYVDSNWDVDELVARKEEITAGGKLSLVLKGDFGLDQFK